MKIKQLTIQNYKSIKELKIVDPAPFSAFIGANGVGKSNIFEAVEFMTMAMEMRKSTVVELFGGTDEISNKKLPKGAPFNFALDLYPADNDEKNRIPVRLAMKSENAAISILMDTSKDAVESNVLNEPRAEYNKHVWVDFSRIFIGQAGKVKLNIDSNHQLKLDGSNLEKVLKRLLLDESIQEEIFEWLSLFIPEFEKLEVYTDSISGKETLLLKMKGYDEPFGRNLISDGTFNILCLLTAVYQLNKPQFLCIEEPENGLNPYVVKQLVQFFRSQCEEKGHYIWVNTHSQTLVSQLKAAEVILVDKKDGFTQVKQLKEENLHGLPLDEAWILADNNLMGFLTKEPGFSFEFPENEEVPFQTIRKIVLEKAGQGVGTTKTIFSRRAIHWGFSIENAAKHPNCPSANYFLNQLVALS